MHNQKPNSSVFTSCPNREMKGRPAWEKCFLIRSLGEMLKREQELVIVAILPPSLFLLFMTQCFSNFTHLSFTGGTPSSLSSLPPSSPVRTRTGLLGSSLSRVPLPPARSNPYSASEPASCHVNMGVLAQRAESEPHSLKSWQ